MGYTAGKDDRSNLGEFMHTIQRILLFIALFTISACGGGGGGGGTPVATTITGVASMGLIMNGAVAVFALNADGRKGAVIGTGSTDSFGAYNVSIGSYVGPVIVEVSGGYIDEATGQSMSVSASSPLRAAVANASGTVTIAVSPLTELAVQRQAGVLTAQSILIANELISTVFKVDIINTLPVAPTVAAFQAGTTTQAQRDYSLLLAAVSQLMLTNGSSRDVALAGLNNGITADGITPPTASAVTSAATAFVANPNNQTSVTTIAGSSLQSIGSKPMKLILSLLGSSASSVKAFSMTIVLPTGVSVRADSTGKVAASVITGIGSALNASIDGTYNPTASTMTIGLISGTTLLPGPGDVLELNVDVAAGTAVPVASAFTVLSSVLKATGGVDVSATSSLALR